MSFPYIVCENGTFGKYCSDTCRHCIDTWYCYHTNGTCVSGCKPGYHEQLCKAGKTQAIVQLPKKGKCYSPDGLKVEGN